MGYQLNAQIFLTGLILALVLITQKVRSEEAKQARGDTGWLWSSSSSDRDLDQSYGNDDQSKNRSYNRYNNYQNSPYTTSSSNLKYSATNHYSNAIHSLGAGFGGGAAGPIYICGWLGGFEGTYALGPYGYEPDIREVAFVASQRIMSKMPLYMSGYY